MDAEFAGLVRGGGDDASAFWVASDDNRLSSELRVVELLDGGVKGVHIHVYNLTSIRHINTQTVSCNCIILAIIGCVASIISGIGNCPKKGIVGEKKLDVNVVFGII